MKIKIEDDEVLAIKFIFNSCSFVIYRQLKQRVKLMAHHENTFDKYERSIIVLLSGGRGSKCGEEKMSALSRAKNRLFRKCDNDDERDKFFAFGIPSITFFLFVKVKEDKNKYRDKKRQKNRKTG